MHAIALWLALAAAPFWESKPARDWSHAELKQMFSDSPWAQTVAGAAVFLATAQPMREAEREASRRAARVDPDFTDFLEEDKGRHIVLAVACAANAMANAGDAKKMEEESTLKAGKKKLKMTGHFPPTPTDPYLRMVFPREVAPGVKSLVFELYLPCVTPPYQMIEFRVKELSYRGAAEM